MKNASENYAIVHDSSFLTHTHTHVALPSGVQEFASKMKNKIK